MYPVLDLNISVNQGHTRPSENTYRIQGEMYYSVNLTHFVCLYSISYIHYYLLNKAPTDAKNQPCEFGRQSAVRLYLTLLSQPIK